MNNYWIKYLNIFFFSPHFQLLDISLTYLIMVLLFWEVSLLLGSIAFLHLLSQYSYRDQPNYLKAGQVSISNILQGYWPFLNIASKHHLIICSLQEESWTFWKSYHTFWLEILEQMFFAFSSLISFRMNLWVGFSFHHLANTNTLIVLIFKSKQLFSSFISHQSGTNNHGSAL